MASFMRAVRRYTTLLWLMGTFSCLHIVYSQSPNCTEGFVNCFDDPCWLAECARFPEAECRANYCGGCNVEFYVDDVLVNCSIPECPLDMTWDAKYQECRESCSEGFVYCFVDPCEVTQCASYPEAECRSNYCGGCNAEFYVNETQVNCSGIPECPAGMTLQACKTGCRPASCDSVPTSSSIPCDDCSEDCFCPDGYVKNRDGGTECIKYEDCPGTPGDGRTTEVYTTYKPRTVDPGAIGGVAISKGIIAAIVLSSISFLFVAGYCWHATRRCGTQPAYHGTTPMGGGRSELGATQGGTTMTQKADGVKYIEPPPSYDMIDTPPSYVEATGNYPLVKD